ncbi:HEPN domain-containing protein [Crocosphaera sp. XPORK-15E]|uniref:HEPN domain-containing protein n=1 Tax=Crocosphaera sp. XPORK-15E TaxID=3110247 RepID=UPI002B21075C|nr:HEPN domain-containing protein [Crocosphaera sp. XPORK-15E]MEA5532680.1 HEPN domain-containing protein [Crocosphaera sp. XPORK-15E]
MTQIIFYLNQADQEIDAATLLLENTYYRACISRCYYSIYCATQALLISKNIKTSTHRGIRQQFGQYFIQTGELSSELAKAMRITYDLRQLGDYDQLIKITQQQAQTALTYAKMFIEEAKKWLNKRNKIP